MSDLDALLKAAGVDIDTSEVDAAYITCERNGDVLAILVNLRMKPVSEDITITVRAMDGDA
jgi:hypothetical protein